MNSIVKKTTLNAPLPEVFKALSESKQFGSWFGMKLDGEFQVGKTIRGTISPTTVDKEVADMQRPYEGKPVELYVDKIEKDRVFAFKWHPFAIDPKVDYSKEPMTTNTFTLTKDGENTILNFTESGFENIPESRRETAMKANDGGWTKQMELIAKYLAKNK